MAPMRANALYRKGNSCMRILAIETTGKYASAAVIGDSGNAVVASSNKDMNHLKEIITLCDEALVMAGISKKDVTHVAAAVGPGSFTGIRIGVTTARTLAQMWGVPCVQISSLKGMAYRAYDDAVRAGCDCIMAIINARRHQTYAGSWNITAQDEGTQTALISLISLDEERQYMIEELLESCNNRSKIYFVGDGIDAYQSIIEEKLPAESYVFAPLELRYQDAGSVAELAREEALAGREMSYENLLPNYMRLAEAEQRLREGTLSSKIRSPQSKDIASEIIFRQATLADAAAITEIEAKTSATPWSRKAIERDIAANENAIVVVAVRSGIVIGYADVHAVVGEAELNNIAVLEQYRGMGIGRDLLRNVMTSAAETCSVMHLEVRRSNAAAIGLYEKMGFKEDGVRPNYYENNGEAAILMSAKL